MNLRDLIVDIESERELQQTINYLAMVLKEVQQKNTQKNTPTTWMLSNSKHGFHLGTNSAGSNAEYNCSSCDIDLVGSDIGYVAAGNNYANGEFAPCPRCGCENQVYRDDNDE